MLIVQEINHEQSKLVNFTCISLRPFEHHLARLAAVIGWGVSRVGRKTPSQLRSTEAPVNDGLNSSLVFSDHLRESADQHVATFKIAALTMWQYLATRPVADGEHARCLLRLGRGSLVTRSFFGPYSNYMFARTPFGGLLIIN